LFVVIEDCDWLFGGDGCDEEWDYGGVL